MALVNTAAADRASLHQLPHPTARSIPPRSPSSAWPRPSRGSLSTRASPPTPSLAAPRLAAAPSRAGAAFCDPSVEYDPDDPPCPGGNRCPEQAPAGGEIPTANGGHLYRCPCPMNYMLERLQAVHDICCAGRADECTNNFHPDDSPASGRGIQDDDCDATVRAATPPSPPRAARLPTGLR